MKDYLSFSFSNIRNRKLRSWLTMIGVFIGIAAVVSLIGLGEGLRSAVIGQFGFLGTDILSVQAAGLAIAGPPGSGVVDPLTDDLAAKIAKINGVERAFNRYIISGTLEFNDQQAIGLAGSVPDGEDRKVMEKILNLEVEQGRLLKDGDGKKVLLGNNFKEDDTFGKGVKTGNRILVNGEKFEVVGILEKKGNFFLDRIVLINEEELLDVTGQDGSEVDAIGVKVKDSDKIDEVKEDIEKLLRKERDVDEGEENFQVSSPQQILESLNSTLFAVQLFVYIIAFISLLVGGIGIMNTMYTSVIERTKEIGIMKSVGAKNSTIFFLFFIESGMMGVVGGIIGILLGMIIAYGLAFVGGRVLGTDLIQAKISLTLLLGALLFSFLVGTVSGIFPALQASKLQPVESLRYAK